MESRATTSPPFRHNVAVCLDDGKCKRQFWEVSRLSVVREDYGSILGLKYIIEIYIPQISSAW